jgi:hypothetical protein
MRVFTLIRVTFLNIRYYTLHIFLALCKGNLSISTVSAFREDVCCLNNTSKYLGYSDADRLGF